MSKKKKIAVGVVFGLLIIAVTVGIVISNSENKGGESLAEVMRDAVLHESNKISLFGLINVNPAYISSCIVVIFLLLFCLIVRIFAIPRFKIIPGKFQLLIEEAVGFFDRLAKSNSPHSNRFLGAYIFAAGCYIFVGTIFELFGIQIVSVENNSIALPAPLSDINAAVSLGCLSYLVILSGGIICNKFRGVGRTLKEFSLPISMSFRLFGALLSGLLVTELVYYTISLSIILPVVVGVMFTLLHALIQTYVLTLLTAMFYGEVSEPVKKHKKSKTKKTNRAKA